MKVIFLKAFKPSQQNETSKSWFKKQGNGNKVNENTSDLSSVSTGNSAPKIDL